MKSLYYYFCGWWVGGWVWKLKLMLNSAQLSWGWSWGWAWQFCQDQYLIFTVLNFENKTKILTKLISSARPLVLFETKTKTSLDLRILSRPSPKLCLDRPSLEFRGQESWWRLNTVVKRIIERWKSKLEWSVANIKSIAMFSPAPWDVIIILCI